MDDVQTHTHKYSVLSTTSAVIAGLNADNQPHYAKLAAATVSGHLPGNVPIRALTVNCWLVQWLKQSIHTYSLLDCTVDPYDLFISDVPFMYISFLRQCMQRHGWDKGYALTTYPLVHARSPFLSRYETEKQNNEKT